MMTEYGVLAIVLLFLTCIHLWLDIRELRKQIADNDDTQSDLTKEVIDLEKKHKRLSNELEALRKFIGGRK